MTEQTESTPVDVPVAPVAIVHTSEEGKKAKAPSKPKPTKQAVKAKAKQPKERKTVKNAKPKKVAGPLVKRKPGPGTKLFKFKPDPEPGLCRVYACPVKAHGLKYCAKHKKEIRKAQLKLNNVTWRKRIKEGTAKHHVVYDGLPTEWAFKKRDQAINIVKAGHSIVPTVQEFKKILTKVKKPEAARAGA